MQRVLAKYPTIPSTPEVERERGHRADPWLMLCVVLLLGTSVLMVFSTTAVFSQQNFGSHTAMLRKHLIHIFLGLGFMATCSRVPLKFLYRISGPFFIVSMVMLAFVLVPGLGSSSGGAQCWLALGPLRLQPGEIAKFASVLFFASYLHRQQSKFASFKTAIVVPMAILGVVSLSSLAQPDFGSTAVIGMIVFCQLFLAARIPHLLAVALAGGVAGSFLVLLSPYRLKRLVTFIDPFQDPSGAGYQLIQSLIAVGAEGVSGAGLGSGKQKLFYLPAAHTDFIFAVIAEELGLIGCLFVLSVFLLVLWRGMELANSLSEAIFPSALALGLTLLIVLPALLNMGVVLGLLPTKGLVLPLIAYGGTAMLVDLAIFGILISLSRYRPR